jgi:hypothetical protein
MYTKKGIWILPWNANFPKSSDLTDCAALEEMIRKERTGARVTWVDRFWRQIFDRVAFLLKKLVNEPGI